MKILMIDDQKEHFQALWNDVRSKGLEWDLRHESRGHSGLRAALGEDFDLVIVDWDFKFSDNASGTTDVALPLAEQKPSLPILMLTQFQTTESAEAWNRNERRLGTRIISLTKTGAFGTGGHVLPRLVQYGADGIWE